VDHEKLLTLVTQKVADGHVLRLIEAMLKAGSYGEGRLIPTERGTPQGGVATPRTQTITTSNLSGRLTSSDLRGTENDTPAALYICLLRLYLYGKCLALRPHNGRNGSILPAYCFSVVGRFPKWFSDLRRHAPFRLDRRIGISSRLSN